FGRRFARQEQREWAAVYLRGLLVADVPRKNVEAMALRLFGAGPGAECHVRALQHFIGVGAWDDDAILAEHQRDVDETLGEDDGVLIIDGSDMPKQGTHSAGVARPGWPAWTDWACTTWRKSPVPRGCGRWLSRRPARPGRPRGAGSRPRRPPAKAPRPGGHASTPRARRRCASMRSRRTCLRRPGSATASWRAARGRWWPTSPPCARWLCGIVCRRRRSGWCCAAKWT